MEDSFLDCKLFMDEGERGGRDDVSAGGEEREKEVQIDVLGRRY